MKQLTALIALASIGLISWSSPAVSSEQYPSRPITWVVPYGAGGLPDAWARTIAKRLSERLGQQVVVDNKPGAGGAIGADAVAKSKGDGYTVLYAGGSPMTIIPLINKSLPYDPKRDFTAVHGIAGTPFLIAVSAKLPFKTLNELIEYAKQNPGKLNSLSTGTGNSLQLTNQLFQRETSTQMTEINYKAVASGYPDLIAGRLDVCICFPLDMIPQIEAGNVRALAVVSDKRARNLPEVPTTAELGYPGIYYLPWAGVVVPKSTPRSIVDKLAQTFEEVLGEPAISDYLERQDSVVMKGMSKERFQEFMDRERAISIALIEKSSSEAK